MIYQKLSEIQKELFVPKGQRNDFGKYNYRSCEDILQAVKPICEAKGCVLTINNDLVNIGDRNYVKATAVLIDLETSEKIESTAHAREELEKKGMDGSQITGSASSYARKYALAGLFCIDNEKDSDATNTHGADDTKPAEVKEEKKATPKQVEFLRAKYTGENLEKLLQAHNITKLEDISMQTASSIIKKIKGE